MPFYSFSIVLLALAFFTVADVYGSLAFQTIRHNFVDNIEWLSAVEADLISTHNLTVERFRDRRESFDWQYGESKTEESTHIACSIIKDSTKASVSYDHTKELQNYGIESFLFYFKRSSNAQCSIVKFGAHKLMELANLSGFRFHRYPSVLKIDSSVVKYFNSPKSFIRNSKIESLLKEADQGIESPYSLSIEWAPYSLVENSPRTLFKNLISAYLQMDRTLKNVKISVVDNAAMDESPQKGKHGLADSKDLFAWESILYKYRSLELVHEGVIAESSVSAAPHPRPRPCIQVINDGLSASARNFSRSVEVEDVLRLFEGRLHCLVLLVHFVSTYPDVLRVSLLPASTIFNYQARGITQGGHVEVEPYSAAGLTGSGQICGVADSGLNDLSCFFLDDSNQYPTLLTNRSGELQPLRRKVIQYTAYADAFDDQGGHGTHVCGSIAGSSLSEFSPMNGMAPDAKISFFDLGMTDRSFLKVPAITDIFQSAHDAGARVHSNSWGNLGGLYGQMSFDLDDFTFENPDFLVLFAGGNFGSEGTKSIISPANAKNVLAVGAGQVRSVFQDSPLGESSYTVAAFSSIGPTYDGRIKPDIIAPGDFIESAYSGSPDLIGRMMDLEEGTIRSAEPSSSPPVLASLFSTPAWSELASCAVHQMSGTSMATPITAGTALLIRQYFMDPKFWAALCNPLYLRCRDGAFAPSGYLLKALFLHSGRAVLRYSDEVYNSGSSYFNSFSLDAPPDPFQGYGEILLSNILPLSAPHKGMHPNLDLVIFDQQEIGAYELLEWRVDLRLAESLTADNSSSASSSGSYPLKITLCWYDPPSVMGASSNLLLNDLDLIVQSPSGALFAGNLGRSIQSEIGLVHTDDANTNEQVTIREPLCHRIAGQGQLDCIYRVFVLSYSLTRKRTQQFALVITTNGTVSGPLSSNPNPVSTSQKHGGVLSAAPSPALIATSFHLNAILDGAEVVSTVVPVSVCTYLVGVQVRVDFDSSDSVQKSDSDGDVKKLPVSDDDYAAEMAVATELHAEQQNGQEEDANNKAKLKPAMPANLELTIVDANKKAVAIGGVDLSMGLARIVTEWPDSWISSKSGLYVGEIGLREAGLHGRGQWRAYLMNSFSSSAVGKFNVSVVMRFESSSPSGTSPSSSTSPYEGILCGADVSPIPSTVPSPSPASSSVSSTSDADKEDKSSSSGSSLDTDSDSDSDSDGSDAGLGLEVKGRSKEVVKEIPIRGVSLAVRLANKVVTPDRIVIANFNLSGSLSSIHLDLDPFDGSNPTRGSSSWLLAVTIKAPNGLVAQVGGYEWLSYSDRFYQRRWPDVWVGKESGGRRWTALRDLHSSGLASRDLSDSLRRVAHRHTPSRWETYSVSGNSTLGADTWTVELAVGNVFGPRPAVNFSGNLILSFTTPEMVSLPSASPSKVAGNSSDATNYPPSRGVDRNNNNTISSPQNIVPTLRPSSPSTNHTAGHVDSASSAIFSFLTSKKVLVLLVFLLVVLLIYVQLTSCCRKPPQYSNDIDDDGSESAISFGNLTFKIRTFLGGNSDSGTGNNIGRLGKHELTSNSEDSGIIYSQIDIHTHSSRPSFGSAALPSSADSSGDLLDSNSSNSNGNSGSNTSSFNFGKRFVGGTAHKNIELVGLKSDSKRSTYGSTEV